MENQNHIHQFVDTIVPATCQTTGYTLHRCACGYEYKDNFTPASDHPFTIAEQNEPTCTTEGSRKLRCAVCGVEAVQTTPALGHRWGQWNVQTVAACLTDGEMQRTCVCCGETEKQTIPAKGHKLTRPEKSKTKKGYIQYFCENCGQTVEQENRKGKMLKRILAICLPIIVLVVLAIIFVPMIIAEYHYSAAMDQMQAGDYTGAYHHLVQCKDHKDAAELLENFEVLRTTTNFDQYGNIENVTKMEYDPETNQIITTEYNAVNGYGVEMTKKRVAAYDRTGNYLGYTSYDEKGRVTFQVAYTYDAAGNETSYTYGTKDYEYYYKYVYVYDSQGYLVKREELDARGKLDNTTTYVYSGDKLLRTKVYDANASVQNTNVYEYDWFGNQISETVYDKNEKLRYTYVYEYDLFGNKTGRACYYGEDKVPSYEYVYEYDLFGNETREASYYNNNKEPSSEYVYSYDLSGNQISSAYYFDGELDQKSTYEYNENGQMLRAFQYNAFGELESKTEHSNYRIVYLPAAAQ